MYVGLTQNPRLSVGHPMYRKAAELSFSSLTVMLRKACELWGTAPLSCDKRKHHKNCRKWLCVLAQISQVDFPILINWMSPLSKLETRVFFLFFDSFFNEIYVSKLISPRWNAVFCSVSSGAFLLTFVP